MPDEMIARSMRAGSTPSASKWSGVREWTTMARDSVVGAASESMTRIATPRRARSMASARPTGPAPTTRTSAVSVALLPPEFILECMWDYLTALVVRSDRSDVRPGKIVTWNAYLEL